MTSLFPRSEHLAHELPPGTPVCVRQVIERRGRNTEREVCGVVVAWEQRPTGSWFAHGKNDKLWLSRLKLRKVDGDVTVLVMDDASTIARIEAVR